MFNITEYFLMEYETVKNRKRLETINAEINAKLLSELEQEQKVVEDKAAEIPDMVSFFFSFLKNGEFGKLSSRTR